MSFSVGIVGLPNVGKSTLFKALTKKGVDIASYPFTTIEPNVGIVAVPDERLEKIASLVKPEKITPTIIEFVDIAGIVRGAHQGEGLGNQFLAQIRNCEAILEVVRTFKDLNIEHVDGEMNPERDIRTILFELLMKDLETIEKYQSKIEKEAKVSKEEQKKLELIRKVKDNLSQERIISKLNLSEEERYQIEDLQLLTLKPLVYLINIKDDDSVCLTAIQSIKELTKENSLVLNLKIEEEVSELSEREAAELGIKSQLDQLIIACYNILDLITFYTIAGGKEARAWTIKRGAVAPEAGGKVHSDFEEKFIRAEVINWNSLTSIEMRPEWQKLSGAIWTKTKELGQVKTVGKDYVVEDGDIIEFKI